jgi:hypothetical protein
METLKTGCLGFQPLYNDFSMISPSRPNSPVRRWNEEHPHRRIDAWQKLVQLRGALWDFIFPWSSSVFRVAPTMLQEY